jgi:hypothetical protein
MIFFASPTPQMKHDVDSANFAKTYIEAQVFEPQLKFYCQHSHTFQQMLRIRSMDWIGNMGLAKDFNKKASTLG